MTPELAVLSIIVSVLALAVAGFTFRRVGQFAEAQFTIDPDFNPPGTFAAGPPVAFRLTNLGPNAASEVSLVCAFDPLGIRVTFPKGRTLAKDDWACMTTDLSKDWWNIAIASGFDPDRSVATVRWRSRTKRMKSQTLTLPAYKELYGVVPRGGGPSTPPGPAGGSPVGSVDPAV